MGALLAPVTGRVVNTCQRQLLTRREGIGLVAKAKGGKWALGIPGILTQLEMEPSVAAANFLFDYGHLVWTIPASTKHHPLGPCQNDRDRDLI